MQFRLEMNELKLLADILLEEDPKQYGGIIDKVMTRDLRFDSDELQLTADLLAARKCNLKNEIAAQGDAALKADLQRRLALLDRVLERVNEACVMF